MWLERKWEIVLLKTSRVIFVGENGRSFGKSLPITSAKLQSNEEVSFDMYNGPAARPILHNGERTAAV